MSDVASPHHLHASIIEAAFAAARQYPSLEVRCPWCGIFVRGKDFQAHGDEHVAADPSRGERLVAIVLAGGRGSRLAPWPAPKCLLPVRGVTILERLLQHLLASVVARVVICTGYRAADVEASVRAHDWDEVSVSFSCAGQDAPMGARLLQARALAGDGRVLICYGDELADVDIRALVAAHASNAITLTAAYQKVPGGSICQNAERTIISENRPVLVNIGFVLVEPQCWDYLHEDDGLSDWINRVSGLASRVTGERGCGHFGVHIHSGRRATVNSLAELRSAEEVWK